MAFRISFQSLFVTSNWFKTFLVKLDSKAKSSNVKEAFKSLTPLTEQKFVSEPHKVLGFIDAIHEDEQGTTLIDYKTSKNDDITEEYKLQLAIYASVSLAL